MLSPRKRRACRCARVKPGPGGAVCRIEVSQGSSRRHRPRCEPAGTRGFRQFPSSLESPGPTLMTLHWRSCVLKAEGGCRRQGETRPSMTAWRIHVVLASAQPSNSCKAPNPRVLVHHRVPRPGCRPHGPPAACTSVHMWPTALRRARGRGCSPSLQDEGGRLRRSRKVDEIS